MNQTVYNTYKSIANRDWGRFLEMTDPVSGIQIKRMAIHNDILLAVLAPFYFIHAGPETLLVIQSIVLGLGALAVYGISNIIFEKKRFKQSISLLFAVSFLLYTPMQRANIFDFHAVVLAITFLLLMVFFWLKKKYKTSFLFLVVSLLAKEEVGLTTLFFGAYTMWTLYRRKVFDRSSVLYSILVIFISIVWVILSFTQITPHFRGSNHFALSYYGDFGDSPIKIIIGIIRNPYSIMKYIIHIDTLRYFIFTMGPVGFLSILSPLRFLIAAPEYAINLLSNNWNMRNIIYHYTSVIQPFIFFASISGAKNLIDRVGKKKNLIMIVSIGLLFCTVVFSYFKGPLPFAREQEIYPFKYPQQATKEVAFWENILKDDSLKIAATGQVAPHFSSRRFIYLFSENYAIADYVVIRRDEIYNYPEKNVMIPLYEKFSKESRFKKIYAGETLEVFKKNL